MRKIMCYTFLFCSRKLGVIHTCEYMLLVYQCDGEMWDKKFEVRILECDTRFERRMFGVMKNNKHFICNNHHHHTKP